MRVQVYRNLRTSNFSSRDAHTLLLVDHQDMVTLYDAKFHASESGRQLMLRTGHKNVHAWVEEELVETEEPSGVLFTYNPRIQDHFYEIETNTGWITQTLPPSPG